MTQLCMMMSEQEHFRDKLKLNNGQKRQAYQGRRDVTRTVPSRDTEQHESTHHRVALAISLAVVHDFGRGRVTTTIIV